MTDEEYADHLCRTLGVSREQMADAGRALDVLATDPTTQTEHPSLWRYLVESGHSGTIQANEGEGEH